MVKAVPAIHPLRVWGRSYPAAYWVTMGRVVTIGTQQLPGYF